MLAGKKPISGGWHPALSINSKTDLPLSLTLEITLCRTSPVTQAFGWLWYSTGKSVFLTPLKQCGFSDFHITIGLTSSCINYERNSNSLLAFLSTLTLPYLLAKTFVWKCLPKHTTFIQVPNILNSITSNNFWQSLLPGWNCWTTHIPWLATNSHFLYIVLFLPAIKPTIGCPESIKTQLNGNFFSFLWELSTIRKDIFDTANKYHRYRASFTSEYLDSRILSLVWQISQAALFSYNSLILSVFLSTVLICVLPQTNIWPSLRTPIFSLSLPSSPPSYCAKVSSEPWLHVHMGTCMHMRCSF